MCCLLKLKYCCYANNAILKNVIGTLSRYLIANMSFIIGNLIDRIEFTNWYNWIESYDITMVWLLADNTHNIGWNHLQLS